MKLGDLRLGNWVKIDVGVGKVSCLMTVEFEDYSLGEGMPIVVDDVEGCACPRSCTAEEVEGVPLTEEILHGCGFKTIWPPLDGYELYSNHRTSVVDDDILSCLNIYSKNNKYFVKEVGMNEIAYVHELQNVFYLVNKEELEVKL